MTLHELFVAQGEESFRTLLRSVSIGTLRTYQIYERLKLRCHLAKLNTENLRTASGRLWQRLSDGDADLALDLSQAILVSNLKLIIAVLNHFQIPHEDGFFAKETDPKAYLPAGWQQQAFNAFRDQYPPAVLVFYLNHLAHEIDENSPVFQPAV
jgi:hypothetical protein